MTTTAPQRTISMPIRFEPAPDCPPGLRPRAPGWFPIDRKGKPGEDDPPPYTTTQRAAARAAWEHKEGCRGPYDRDGIKRVVDFTPDQGPPRTITLGDGGYVYALDPTTQRTGTLLYRYQPAASPAHAATMAGIEEALIKSGPGAAARATTDLRDEN